MSHQIEGVGFFSAPNDIFKANLGAYPTLVYLYLCRMAGPDGGCWPRHATIADACGISVRTVQTALRTLLDAGFITCQKRESARGAFCSNLFSIVNRQMVPSAPPAVGKKCVLPTAPRADRRIPSDKNLETPSSPPQPKPKVPTKPEREQWFQEFCKAYPKRAGGDGRSKAAEKFDELLRKGVDPAEIVAGAKRYAASVDAEDQTGTRFVCQKPTWLNQRRWEDDYGAVPDEIPWEGGIEEQKRRALAYIERKREEGDADFI